MHHNKYIYHPIKGTTLVEPPVFSEHVWVVGTWHHSTTGTSALGMIWTTSTTTFDNPRLDCTQFVQQCAINRALVIDPTISPISSMT